MSVGFTKAVADGLRFNNVPVSFEPGYERRGNGQSFPSGRPYGTLIHHTGADFGAGLWILINGRPDLSGPLCNSCTFPDGRMHIVAAHPANHAGASGGRSMGPLPITTLFNRIVWGNEIMYPGSKPMTSQQYRSACILGGVISGILGYKNVDYVRLHAETSITGKWDAGAGRGAGVALDGNRFRADIWPALHSPPVPVTTLLTDEVDMIKLPRTNTPPDANSPPSSWSQRNYTVGWNLVDGWMGKAAFSFGVQDWGSRTVDTARGFLLLASWIFIDGRRVPVDRTLTKEGGGLIIWQHKPTIEYVAPPGCVGVTLNYAAPSDEGAYVAVGRSG